MISTEKRMKAVHLLQTTDLSYTAIAARLQISKALVGHIAKKLLSITSKERKNRP